MARDAAATLAICLEFVERDSEGEWDAHACGGQRPRLRSFQKGKRQLTFERSVGRVATAIDV